MDFEPFREIKFERGTNCMSSEKFEINFVSAAVSLTNRHDSKWPFCFILRNTGSHTVEKRWIFSSSNSFPPAKLNDDQHHQITIKKQYFKFRAYWRNSLSPTSPSSSSRKPISKSHSSSAFTAPPLAESNNNSTRREQHTTVIQQKQEPDKRSMNLRPRLARTRVLVRVRAGAHPLHQASTKRNAS